MSPTRNKIHRSNDGWCTGIRLRYKRNRPPGPPRPALKPSAGPGSHRPPPPQRPLSSGTAAPQRRCLHSSRRRRPLRRRRRRRRRHHRPHRLGFGRLMSPRWRRRRHHRRRFISSYDPTVTAAWRSVLPARPSRRMRVHHVA
jgi:hypothetical protein